jgi:hypothetical protein
MKKVAIILLLFLINIHNYSQKIGYKGFNYILNYKGTSVIDISSFNLYIQELRKIMSNMDTIPPNSRLIIYQDAIQTLKNKGLWDKIASMYITASNTENNAFIDWKRPGTKMTKIGITDYVEDGYIAGNGINSYFNLNFIPSTDGAGIYQDDSATMLIYVSNKIADDIATDIGSGDGVNNTGLRTYTTSDIYRAFVNQTLSFGNSAMPSDTSGYFTAIKYNSTGTKLYHNKDSLFTDVRTTASLPGTSYFLGAWNNQGIAQLFSMRHYKAVVIGNKLTTNELGYLIDILETILNTDYEDVIPLFKMGAINGNTVTDISGKGNDLLIKTRCADFKGGYFDYGTTAELTGPMTISFWAKGQGSNNISSGVGRIGNSSSRGYNLGIGDNGSYVMYIAPDQTSLVQASTTLSQSDSMQWVHYMGTYSPNNYIRIFRNGEQVGEQVSGIPASQYSNSNALSIGAWGDGDNNFAGQMADVRIYDTVKTYSQINEFDTTHLVFWDMLQSWYNDTSYTLTGHKGIKKEGIVFPTLQNSVRYPRTVVKINYGNLDAYIPFSYDSINNQQSYMPIFSENETIVDTIVSSLTGLFENEERFMFSNNTDMANQDKLKIFYNYSNTPKLSRFQWLNNLGDYFSVIKNNGIITDMSYNVSQASYDSIDMYVNWGQSNCQGQINLLSCPDSLKFCYESYVTVYEGIDTFTIVNNVNQFGEKENRFGYELSLAKEFFKLINDSIIWCKYAIGGTAIHDIEQWSAKDNRYHNYFDSLLLHIDNTIYYGYKKTGKAVKLRGVVQYQGESDATSSDYANDYADNLTQFYSKLIGHVGDSVYVYPVTIATTLPMFSFYNTVNTGIINFVLSYPYAQYIIGANYSLSGDNLHHDQDGYIELGKSISDSIYYNK